MNACTHIGRALTQTILALDFAEQGRVQDARIAESMAMEHLRRLAREAIASMAKSERADVEEGSDGE